jgi:hypothetical protein
MALPHNNDSLFYAARISDPLPAPAGRLHLLCADMAGITRLMSGFSPREGSRLAARC